MGPTVSKMDTITGKYTANTLRNGMESDSQRESKREIVTLSRKHSLIHCLSANGLRLNGVDTTERMHKMESQQISDGLESLNLVDSNGWNVWNEWTSKFRLNLNIIDTKAFRINEYVLCVLHET